MNNQMANTTQPGSRFRYVSAPPAGVPVATFAPTTGEEI